MLVKSFEEWEIVQTQANGLVNQFVTSDSKVRLITAS